MSPSMLRRLDESSSSNTLYIIIGAAVGVVALLVVAAGVALCRRERRRARALADMEQYVHVAPAPPASQLSPGISATKGAVPAAAALPLPPLSSRAANKASPPQEHVLYYAVTSPGGAYAAPAAQGSSFRDGSGSFGASTALHGNNHHGSASLEYGEEDPTLSLSQRSRSNSFEKHDSYRRFMYGEQAAGTVRMDTIGGSTSASAARSALWDDPAIVAARIPLDKLEVGALLSRGGFGEVLVGFYRAQKVAVKRLLPETRRELLHIEQFLAEIRLMATLEHPKVVRFVGVAWDALSDLCVASEFMAGGDLRSLLSAFNEDTNTSTKCAPRPQGFDADKARIALDVAHALTYLHCLEPMVLHRDLKSRNVLLDAELRAKLTDFGVSRERLGGDARTLTAGVGTLLWMAPEVMMGDRYDHKADMFSFGVLLSELDTQQLPYTHAKVTDTGRAIPDAAILQLVACGELRAHFSRPTSPAGERIARLGERCVAVEPEGRPTAAEALYQLQLAVRECEQERETQRQQSSRLAASDVDENRSFLF